VATDLYPIGNHTINFQNRAFLELAMEIKTNYEWTFEQEDEYDKFFDNKCIEFEGPFNLSLSFDTQKILFSNPPYRYWWWFEMEYDLHRDEWRKYMQTIVSAFGGDRVIYLADNSHPLEVYINCEGTFEDIENVLFQNFGESKRTFKEVAEDFENSYLVDKFENIDWCHNEPMDNYHPLIKY
jgi:hypothetical protein